LNAVARVAEESIVIGVAAETVFDVLHDYHRRLEWDPFLRRAEVEDGAEKAGLGISTYCAARMRSGGFGMRTVYVSFRRPEVAAVKMTDGPWFLGDFAASITQKELAERRTRVTYKFSFSARPRWAAPVVEPLFKARFRHETRRRLESLKAHLESSVQSPANK
jgi:hypothetical protein